MTDTVKLGSPFETLELVELLTEVQRLSCLKKLWNDASVDATLGTDEKNVFFNRLETETSSLSHSIVEKLDVLDRATASNAAQLDSLFHDALASTHFSEDVKNSVSAYVKSKGGALEMTRVATARIRDELPHQARKAKEAIKASGGGNPAPMPELACQLAYVATVVAALAFQWEAVAFGMAGISLLCH